ncbi:serum response factor-binding protein 1-like [Helianthus annuus]|uniref:serum response factor-binding protein 1-like n=1 Tax=Helianthus annuus TaxID=4232 RepID=UPI001652CFEB|nr:serum response factor-binding protein 1-like [Helianthus annuus]
MIKFDLGQVKEAYETLARSIKMIQKESVKNDKATKFAKARLFDKQKEVNFHLDTIASLKKELELAKIENDRIDKKLMSYVASSYVLEQIVPQQPHTAPVFKSVPPPIIDVTFSPSDTDNESQVIKTVVDQVLDEESEKSEKAQSEKVVSDSEDEGNFLDRYVPKSEKSANDDPIMCQKVIEKPVVVKPVQKQTVQKPSVQKQTVSKPTVQKSNIQKPQPKSPIDTKGKKPMVSPIRILKEVNL